jgi:hypothetical protein
MFLGENKGCYYFHFAQQTSCIPQLVSNVIVSTPE